MKLTNKTRWSTDDLRALISACLKSHGVPSTGLRVEIIHTRRSHHTAHGWATLGRWKRRSHLDEKVFRPGRWMKLIMASPETVEERCADFPKGGGLLGATARSLANSYTRNEFFLRVARVIDHEVAHLRGLDHSHMSETTYNCTQAVPWAEGFKLEAEQEEPKDKAAMRSDRLEHARTMLKKATTREKRATTSKKKWERRVRALERT